jgi:hypothetical protein
MEDYLFERGEMFQCAVGPRDSHITLLFRSQYLFADYNNDFVRDNEERCFRIVRKKSMKVKHLKLASPITPVPLPGLTSENVLGLNENISFANNTISASSESGTTDQAFDYVYEARSGASDACLPDDSSNQREIALTGANQTPHLNFLNRDVNPQSSVLSTSKCRLDLYENTFSNEVRTVYQSTSRRDILYDCQALTGGSNILALEDSDNGKLQGQQRDCKGRRRSSSSRTEEIQHDKLLSNWMMAALEPRSIEEMIREPEVNVLRKRSSHKRR